MEHRRDDPKAPNNPQVRRPTVARTGCWIGVDIRSAHKHHHMHVTSVHHGFGRTSSDSNESLEGTVVNGSASRRHLPRLTSKNIMNRLMYYEVSVKKWLTASDWSRFYFRGRPGHTPPNCHADEVPLVDILLNMQGAGDSDWKNVAPSNSSSETSRPGPCG